MQNHDYKKTTGRLTIIKHDGKTNKDTVYKFENLVVDTGLEWIAARMADVGIPDAMSHMEIGSGSTAAAASDTALESTLARVAITATNVSGADTEYTATWVPGVGTGTLYEAGIFNAGAGGVMLSRTVFPIITKQVDDTIYISWVITQQQP